MQADLQPVLDVRTKTLLHSVIHTIHPSVGHVLRDPTGQPLYTYDEIVSLYRIRWSRDLGGHVTSSTRCILHCSIHGPTIGTIIGGLSPRRIRGGSDRVRSDPPTSPPERPPRRTQADSGGPQKSPPSPPESAADPIGSAINWRTVRQKMAEKSLSRKVRGGQSPLIGGQSPLIGRQSPPRIKSAADKVRHCPPGEKYPGAIIGGLGNISGGTIPRRTPIESA